MKQLVRLNDFADLTKDEIRSRAQIDAERIDETKALDAWILRKKLQDYIAELGSELKEKAIDRYTKYMGVNVAPLKAGKAEIQLQHGTPILDYQADPVYKKMYDQLKEREKDLKDSYNHYQKRQAPLPDGNGEIIPVVPVKSYRADALKVNKY